MPPSSGCSERHRCFHLDLRPRQADSRCFEGAEEVLSFVAGLRCEDLRTHAIIIFPHREAGGKPVVHPRWLVGSSIWAEAVGPFGLEIYEHGAEFQSFWWALCIPFWFSSWRVFYGKGESCPGPHCPILSSMLILPGLGIGSPVVKGWGLCIYFFFFSYPRPWHGHHTFPSLTYLAKPSSSPLWVKLPIL